MNKPVVFETAKPITRYPHLANENNVYQMWVEIDSRKDTKNKRLKQFYKQVAELLEPNDNSVTKILRV